MKFLLFLAMTAAATAGNNVLLIIADDYGVDAHSLYNPSGTTAPTPNINSLAASGVRFTQAYACPVCAPTRATILTGRLGFRTGVGDVASGASSLTSAELTLPEVITQNSNLSIAAASFGKWHLSSGTSAAVRNLPNTIGGWPHYAGATSGALTDYSNWTKTINGVNTTSTTYATTDVVNDTHQSYYHRLRFNLGRYTTAAAVSPLGHSVDTNGFNLTVPENPAATQTMWQSTELDFWSPVSGATRSASSATLTFSAPRPLPEKCFYSVLSE